MHTSPATSNFAGIPCKGRWGTSILHQLIFVPPPPSHATSLTHRLSHTPPPSCTTAFVRHLLCMPPPSCAASHMLPPSHATSFACRLSHAASFARHLPC